MLTIYQIIKKNYFLWALVAAITCIEFLLFKYRVLRDISPYYPIAFDQNNILLLAYKIYENIKHSGFFVGIQQSFFLSTGPLFPYQAVLSFFIFGANRFTAMLPNFIYFIALQWITLLTLHKITYKKYLIIFMLGLILALQYPLQIVGGIYDFRMDLIAFCAYGMFIASVIKSRIFLDKNWSMIAACLAILIIVIRTITIAYVLSILISMIIYLCYQFKKSSIKKNDYKKRLINTFIIFLCILSIGLTFIWLNKEALYNYYIIGHFTNNEKNIRAIEAGIKTNFQMFLYYPHMLFSHQMGKAVNYLITIFLSVSFISYIMTRKYFNTNKQSFHTIDYWQDGLVFLLFCIFVPLIILTYDTSKSSIVGSIIIMPVLWLVIWVHFFLDKNCNPHKYTYWVFNAIAVISLAIGVLNLTTLSPKKQHSLSRQDLITITKMHKDVGNYAIQHHWSTMNISTDRTLDYLFYTDFMIAQYETQHTLTQISPTALGGSILPASDDEMIKALKNSNIVILNISDNYPSSSPYPSDLKIALLKPQLMKIVKSQFTPLGDYKIKQSIYRVYKTSGDY